MTKSSTICAWNFHASTVASLTSQVQRAEAGPEHVGMRGDWEEAGEAVKSKSKSARKQCSIPILQAQRGADRKVGRVPSL